MIFYFASPTYQPMIAKVIKETDEVVAGCETGENIFFRKYIKENIRIFEQVELMLIDVTALADTDDEIIMAIESLKLMDYGIRIILLAPMRQEGDALLRQCFYMGIYDIINTDEYLKIHDELTRSIEKGMNYKDAICFRTQEKKEQEAEKKPLQKVMVGLAGTGPRMGCTHNSIVLANFLREKNYMVAVAEMNGSGAFEKICRSRKEQLYEEGYFSIKGVDMYPACTSEKLAAVAGRLYNFILLDFGNYYEADKVLLNRCNERIILTGVKPWEVEQINGIFEEQDEVVLKDYHFCFLSAESNPKLQKEVLESMEPLENIYFPEYTADPFESSCFSEANAILKEYLQGTGREQRKGFLPWNKRSR